MHTVQKIKLHIVQATVCTQNNPSATTALHDQSVLSCQVVLWKLPPYTQDTASLLTTNPCVGLSCCTNFFLFSWPRFAQAGGQQAGSSCCLKWASVVQPCLYHFVLCTKLLLSLQHAAVVWAFWPLKTSWRCSFIHLCLGLGPPSYTFCTTCNVHTSIIYIICTSIIYVLHKM